MNSRERTLLYTLFGVLVVAGYGAGVYYFFFDGYLSARGQLSRDRAELDKKTKALADAEADQQRMFDRDPRLKDWRTYSAPDLAPVKGGGKHTEDEITRHRSKNQSDYQREVLSALLEKHRFTGVKIVAKPPDTKTLEAKSGPASKDKTPIMTRFPFTVDASGTYASIIDLLHDFYNQPLLHEVRTLTITKPATTREGGERGQPVLDLAMTVELLMVTGAEPRAALLPSLSKSDMAQVLASSPTREYNAMLDKDLFNGSNKVVVRDPRTETTVPPEEVAKILSFVRLTSIFESNTDSDHVRWGKIATFYNQWRGGGEMRVHLPTIFGELKVPDDKGQTVFTGKLVYIDATKVVLEVKGKYYLVHVGDFLQTALERQELRRSEDLKKYGLESKVAATKETD